MNPDTFQKQPWITKNPEPTHQHSFRREDLQDLDIIVPARISVSKSLNFRKPSIYYYLLNIF